MSEANLSWKWGGEFEFGAEYSQRHELRFPLNLLHSSTEFGNQKRV